MGPAAATGELPAGAIAWATEKVKAPCRSRYSVRHLLGEVVLVARSRRWRRRLKQQFPALAFATLAGELISTSGVIYGGRVNEENSSLFAAKRRSRRLAAEHRQLLDDREPYARTSRKFSGVTNETTEHLERSASSYQAARGEHSATALQSPRSSANCTKAAAKRTRSSGKEPRSTSNSRLRRTGRAAGNRNAAQALLREERAQRQRPRKRRRRPRACAMKNWPSN